MFDICFSTPSVMNEDGIPQAGAQLRLGNDIFVFTIDLSHWSIPEYEQQWREGIWRLLEGASSSALMTAYAGPNGHMHHMWAFWREEKYLYVQQHAVRRAYRVRCGADVHCPGPVPDRCAHRRSSLVDGW